MTGTNNDARHLKIGRFKLRVPRRRGVRVALGLALLVRGLLPPAGPVLLPAALTLLSMDVPRLRRLRRRLLVWLGRLRSGSRCRARNGDSMAPAGAISGRELR